MPLMFWATHVLQWPVQKAAKSRGGANLKNRSQFGLQAATRLHEAGVASNRGSECRGECVPGSCTHRPSHHGSWGCPDVYKRQEFKYGTSFDHIHKLYLSVILDLCDHRPVAYVIGDHNDKQLVFDTCLLYTSRCV